RRLPPHFWRQPRAFHRDLPAGQIDRRRSRAHPGRVPAARTGRAQVRNSGGAAHADSQGCGRGPALLPSPEVLDGASMHFLLSALSIVMIDLLLAGDNALVIAMAVRGLPKEERRLGILCGAGG